MRGLKCLEFVGAEGATAPETLRHQKPHLSFEL